MTKKPDDDEDRLPGLSPSQPGPTYINSNADQHADPAGEPVPTPQEKAPLDDDDE